MKILHILSDGPQPLSERIIAVQSEHFQVEVVDLSKEETGYEAIVDSIFECDKVISW